MCNRGKEKHTYILGESYCIEGIKFLNSYLNPFDEHIPG